MSVVARKSFRLSKLPISAPNRGLRTLVKPYLENKSEVVPDPTPSSPSPPKAVDELSTVPSLWPELAKAFPQATALDDPHFHPPTQLSFAQVHQTVLELAGGLLEKGLQPGEHVALFSEDSHRWLLADQALMTIGCVPCVRGGTTASPDDLCHILGAGSGSTAAFVQDPATARKLAPYFSPGGAGYSQLLQAIEKAHPVRFLIVMRDWAEEGGDSPAALSEALGGLPVYTFDQVLEAGRASASARLRAQASLRSGLGPSEPATLTYTSGTTGVPKGVVLTHANLMYQVKAFPFFCPVDPGDRVLSMLPTWHVYARAAQYYVLSRGATLTYSNVKKLASDLPGDPRGRDFLVTVPLVLDTLHQRIQAQVAKAPPLRRFVAKTLLAAALLAVRQQRKVEGLDVRAALRDPRGGVPLLSRLWALLLTVLLRPLVLLARRLVFAKVLQGLNIRKAIISGGGSLAPHLDDFFEAAGLPVINGWGLSETSPVLACRRLAFNPRGTVGLPTPGTEIKAVDPEDPSRDLPPGTKGLLLARGPGVFREYYRSPHATESAFVGPRDARWFSTGDQGVVIPPSKGHRLGGCVVLTGRVKDTIVLKSGENVEPGPLEEAIACSPLVKQVVVLGNDQRNLGALVVPDYDYIRAMAAEQRTSFTDKEIEDKLYAEVNRAVLERQGYVPHEKVQRIVVLRTPFSPEDGTLTRTMKVRRDQVQKVYRAEVERLFRDGHGGR